MKSLLLGLAAGLAAFGALVAAPCFSAPGSKSQSPTAQRGVVPTGQLQSAVAPQSAGPYFALVVGINDYRYLPKLKTAIGDADAVADVLHRDYGFKTRTLHNATRDQIESALNQYRVELPADANLLIYYAGHGAYDKEADKAYWLPVDARQDDNSRWILADVITTDIKVIKARHVIIIADSCYSGGLSRAVNPDFAPKEPRHLLETLMQGRSRTLMSSGGLEPVADAGGSGHSVFAGAFLQGLKGERNESFSALTLFSFVQRFVAGNSEQVPRYTSLPNSGDSSGDFVFLRNSVARAESAPAAKPDETVSAEKNPDAAPRESRAESEDASPPAPSDDAAAPSENMKLAPALAVLQRAAEMMPSGDIGQVLAIESLVRQNHSLGGVELWGLSLKRGQFDNGDFSKATMVAVDLTGASAVGADFTRTNFAFAVLSDAHLSGAIVEKAKFDFADLGKAQLQNAKASSSRWMATDAHGANFTGADLKGARFMFVDLRNAVFDGADLTGAFLVGSDLSGASFKKAKLGNTDFSGSIFDPKTLEASQASGACQTHYEVGHSVFNFVIIEEIPNSQFSGGVEHSRFFEKDRYFKMPASTLQTCAKRQYSEDTWYPFWDANGKDYVREDFGEGFPAKFVEKRGDDLRSRSNQFFEWIGATLTAASSAK